MGAVVQEGLAEFDAPRCATLPPEAAARGSRFLAADGQVIHTEDRFSSALVYFGGDAPIGKTAIFVSTPNDPHRRESVRLGFASVGTGRIFADGELLRETTSTSVGADLGAAFMSPPVVSGPITLDVGRTRRVRIELDRTLEGGLSNAFSITVGVEPHPSIRACSSRKPSRPPRARGRGCCSGNQLASRIRRLRPQHLALPGRQDDLVRAVVAATPAPLSS